MDDPRWEPGMPVLDRQTAPDAPAATGPAGPPAPPGGAAVPPRSVPEIAPTPLQRVYVQISAAGLVCGAVAITALELGVNIADPIVKLPVVVGAPLLLVTTADAMIRIWRSAWAWMPVNPGRGFFRLAWLAAAGVGFAAIAVAGWLVVLA